jgi:hypothetical protein
MYIKECEMRRPKVRSTRLMSPGSLWKRYKIRGLVLSLRADERSETAKVWSNFSLSAYISDWVSFYFFFVSLSPPDTNHHVSHPEEENGISETFASLIQEHGCLRTRRRTFDAGAWVKPMPSRQQYLDGRREVDDLRRHEIQRNHIGEQRFVFFPRNELIMFF